MLIGKKRTSGFEWPKSRNPAQLGSSGQRQYLLLSLGDVTDLEAVDYPNHILNNQYLTLSTVA